MGIRGPGTGFRCPQPPVVWNIPLLLDTIDRPEDLRALDEDQLLLLAGEIRQFIVQSVSATGGHLGSNLGAVELTLALRRAFDSPKNFIL